MPRYGSSFPNPPASKIRIPRRREAALLLLRLVLLAACGLPGGCLEWVERHPPVPPTRLPAITFHFTIPEAGVGDRLNIARTGEIYVQSRQRGIAHAVLSDAQVAALQKVFVAWDRLPATYASEPEGPFYVLSYGGHAVTGGSLANAPEPFRQAVGELGRIMDTLHWETR